jgi:hypothetical protein
MSPRRSGARPSAGSSGDELLDRELAVSYALVESDRVTLCQ